MTSEERQRIGDTIRQVRKNKKITQTQLGAEIGVGKVAIANYESGKIKVIPFEKRVKLSEALNVPITNLLYENEKKVGINTSPKGKVIETVSAYLDEWQYSGDVDSLRKAMAVIRAAIEKEEE